MNHLRRGSLVAAIAVLSVLASAAVASAAVLSTSGTSSPYTGAFQARSSTNITFTFPTGVITCAHAYGLIANGTVTNATIGSTFANVASVGANNTFLGNNLTTSATKSTACTSSISAVSTCTSQNPGDQSPLPSPGTGIPAYTVQARTNSGNTGVDAQLGPIQVTVNCTARSDGSLIASCKYITGTTTSGAAITGSSEAFAGTPAKAGTLTFSNQPFVKVSGPAACPAATSSAPGKFSGSLQLFTSGGTQIYAYK